MADSLLNPIPAKSIGRNDICSCGSGRRYKNCCGSMAATIPSPHSNAIHERMNRALRHHMDAEYVAAIKSKEAGDSDQVIDPITGPLIVTSAINPPEGMPFLRLADPQLRLFQTYCGLIRWIKETKITNIVLCDNSGIDHVFSELAILAEQHHKRLEVLVFKGDHGKVCAQGKGFGEGEIMKHVMEHSVFFREDTAFYKVTGRIFVEGFDALHDSHATQSVVFCLPAKMAEWRKAQLGAATKDAAVLSCLRLLRKDYVETTIYKCTKQFYMENLLDCFRHVDDGHGYWLEHALMAPLLVNGFDVFSVRPRLVGVCASKGILYGGVDYSDEVKSLATVLLSRQAQDISGRRRE